MDYIELANKAIEDRKRLVEQRKAVLETGSFTDADKAQRAAKIDADIDRLYREATYYVERAEQDAEVRSAIKANPIGVPGGDREIRGGELLHAEVRAISGGSGHGAAFTPAENANYALDYLVKRTAFLASGVQVIPTTGDSIVIPHLTSDGTAAAVAEATQIPMSDPVAESLTAIPRAFAQGTPVSNEVLADSTPSSLEALSAQLLRSVGNAFDVAAFEGSGVAPNIKGLRNVAGIQSVSMGTNGGQLTNLDPIADALGKLVSAGADDDNAAIVMPPDTWAKLLKLKELSTGSNKLLMQDSAGSGSGKVSKTILGRPVYLCSNLSLNETQGSATAASSIYVYDPAHIYAVIREDALFTVNPYIYGDKRQTLLQAEMRADVLVANPSAVVRIQGVL
ncbi:phage major capsid protein [Actinoplanes sp. NPDC048988]|uniref:phage major capsid protein n=1 Tax=Actinoplanes sp. NPDC048988 TaxID=3363901 RepID=UPI003715F211